ncbi:Lysylphosphatidylglycerol synthase TM region [anaerobic digester metagenome]
MKQFYVLVVSFVLLILLVLWLGPSNIIHALETADLRFIVLAAFIHLVVIGVRSLRWGFIINQTTEFKKNYVVKTIGLFAGNFSPARSAGEVLNAVAGKKINGISLSEGLSAGLTERFFDVGIAGCLMLISSLFLPKIRVITILGGLLSIGMVLLIYIFNWRENASIWLYDRIHPIISKLPIREEVLNNLYLKFTEGLRGMIQYTHSFSNFKNLTFVFFLSGASWLLECVRLLVVFYAFNVEINFTAIVVIFLIANLVGIVTALPGGIGSIEISLTGLFVLFGVPGALSGSIALVDRLVSFWLVTALGIIFSSYYAKDILEDIKGYTLDLKGSE